jgi:FMN phosphatase YigB (HAD superfamily)
VLDTYDVLFRRSPRYLEDALVEEMDAASHGLSDEASWLSGFARRHSLAEAQIDEVLDRLAAKYCKNLDVWKELPGWRGRFRLVALHRGPAGVLVRWSRAHGLDLVADTLVATGSWGLDAGAPDLYRRLCAAIDVAPGACLIVDDERAPIEAARAAGLAVYRFGTVHGLRAELVAGH